MKININEIALIVFDFDGVLTDNKVFVTQDGKEFVACSRADGLAFDYIRKNKINTCILSTEKNGVVSHRAKKLGVPVFQSVADKEKTLNLLLEEQRIRYENVVYVGNDLNDYYAMLRCGIKICPSDAHERIKKISDFVLQSRGGDGVAREILEDVFSLDLLT